MVVLRANNNLYIFNPRYTPGQTPCSPSLPGVKSIAGRVNVVKLLRRKEMNVSKVYMTVVGSTELDCMGRSAEWFDKVAGGHTTASFPEGWVPEESTVWDEMQRS